MVSVRPFFEQSAAAVSAAPLLLDKHESRHFLFEIFSRLFSMAPWVFGSGCNCITF